MDKRHHPDTFIRLYKSVVSNSAVWSGAPSIVGTWTEVTTIIGWMRVLKNADAVSAQLGISIEQVKDAVWYYKKTNRPIKSKETFRKFTGQ